MKLFFVKSIEPFISKLPAAAQVGAGMRYTLRDAKIGNSLYTTGINTCSGFGLRAGEQNLLGHIKPEDFNPRNFAGAFEKLVKDFQNKYGEVRALVFGGREISFIDPHCRTRSNEVSATMCDVLSTKCNIPDENFASIMGKFTNIKTNDNMAVIGDKVYLANKEFEKAGLLSAPKDKIETLAQDVYEDVFIPKSFLV